MVKWIFTINVHLWVLWREDRWARNQTLPLSLMIYLSTALRICAIQEFLSSFELVWISYISGPFKEALIKNIAFSSLATSLTINFCNEITGGLESCKTKYNLLHYTIHVLWGLCFLAPPHLPTYTGPTWAITSQHSNFIAMASSHDIFYIVIFYSSTIDENMEWRMHISKTRGLGTDWMLKHVSI